MLIIRSEQTESATQKNSQPQMAAKTPPPPPPLFSEEELFEFETKPNVVAKSTAAEDTATKGTKKSKKGYKIQRIWSEEDEIVILKGLIDYRSKKKSEDLNDFHDFIKKKLHIDVARVQLQRKIGKMKIKYENNKSKKRIFSKSLSHDQKAYDLSEMVWGNQSGRGEKVVRKTANKKVNAVVEDVKKNEAVVVHDVKKNEAVESEDDVKNAAVTVMESGEGENSAAAGAKRVMSMEERMLIAGREMYELGQEGVEREEEWQKLRVEELELYQKEMEVRAAKTKVRIAQTKLVLDGIKRGRKLNLF